MKYAKSLVLCAVVFAISQTAEAAPAVWTVNSAQSYVRLNLPDQAVSYLGVNITARIRNQNGNTAWTDAGGRAATPSGTFTTNLEVESTNPTSITFLSGQQNLIALDNKPLTPNPALWDEETETYLDPLVTAQAAYGGQLRGFALFGALNANLAFFSISEVKYDMSSDPLAVVGGSFTGGSTFGLSDGLFAVDGQTTTGVVEVEVPDLLEEVPNFGGDNIATSTITYIGVDEFGNDLYEMVYNINVPISLDVDVDDNVVSIVGSAVGVIVATGYIVPEPASIGLAAMGALALAGCLIRRRRA